MSRSTGKTIVSALRNDRPVSGVMLENYYSHAEAHVEDMIGILGVPEALDKPDVKNTLAHEAYIGKKMAITLDGDWVKL